MPAKVIDIGEYKKAKGLIQEPTPAAVKTPEQIAQEVFVSRFLTDEHLKTMFQPLGTKPQ